MCATSTDSLLWSAEAHLVSGALAATLRVPDALRCSSLWSAAAFFAPGDYLSSKPFNSFILQRDFFGPLHEDLRAYEFG